MNDTKKHKFYFSSCKINWQEGEWHVTKTRRWNYSKSFTLLNYIAEAMSPATFKNRKKWNYVPLYIGILFNWTHSFKMANLHKRFTAKDEADLRFLRRTFGFSSTDVRMWLMECLVPLARGTKWSQTSVKLPSFAIIKEKWAVKSLPNCMAIFTNNCSVDVYRMAVYALDYLSCISELQQIVTSCKLRLCRKYIWGSIPDTSDCLLATCLHKTVMCRLISLLEFHHSRKLVTLSEITQNTYSTRETVV